MKARALFLPLFFAFSLLAAKPLPEYYGILTEKPRLILTHDWEAQRVGDVQQVERAYCVASYEKLTTGEATIYVVTELTAATVVRPLPWQIDGLFCPTKPDGSNMPTVHTHPASRCDHDSGLCTADSSRMTPAKCQPSQIDMGTLVRRRVPFSIVQCSPTLWTFYGPPPE